MVHGTVGTARGLDEAVVRSIRGYIVEMRIVGDLMREAALTGTPADERLGRVGGPGVDPLVRHLRRLREAG